MTIEDGMEPRTPQKSLRRRAIKIWARGPSCNQGRILTRRMPMR